MNEHRPMPSHPEAERELLGWLMLGRDDTSEVFALLKPDDFHDARHVRVFEAMADLHRERKVIDLITVSSLMHSLGTMPYLVASGSDAYLSELMIGCSYFSTEQQMEHAGMVLDAARKRGIIMASAEMAERAYRGDATSAQIVEAYQAKLGLIADRGHAKVPRDLRSLIHEAIQRVEKAYSRPVHERVALTGVTTGLASLDELTRGYQGSELFIIGGRPSMGKTAFVLNSILAAAEKGHPVLKFSLEMVDRENADRILSLDSGVPGSWLKTGMLNTRDWVNITKSSARLSALNVKIDDDATQGIESICSKARKWRRDPKVFKTGNELGLIVLDYLQLVHVDSTSRSNREQDVTKIGRALKALSKELNVALVALASLSRQCEARTDKRPVMSDLRESGNLESDADSVLMLYRDEVYNAEAEKGLAELIMRKGRNSGVGTVMARWDAATMKFADIEGTK